MAYVFENPESQSAKRKRSLVPKEDKPAPPESTNAVAPELAGRFSARLVSMFEKRVTGFDAFSAVLDELDAMPGVAIPVPATERDEFIQNMLMMDSLLEAVENARNKLKREWSDTAFFHMGQRNFVVVDRQYDDGDDIEDGCAICGVPKRQCMKQDEHFGARGESPPDAVCPHCKFNFHNKWSSPNSLGLHIRKHHSALPEVE
ncbi:MAG: hypothetical protein EBR09_14660 [Proteobacteria bacterium]|jgi:hypothetical protein|nr:hypothetical protein [Pseudomonadota bacterium]